MDNNHYQRLLEKAKVQSAGERLRRQSGAQLENQNDSNKAQPSDRPKHYCGIFGIFNHPDAARLTHL